MSVVVFASFHAVNLIAIDAAGCQKNIAQQIIDGDGDYVLALKANHRILNKHVHQFFNDHLEDEFARQPVSRFVKSEKSHSREEHRT